MGTYIRHVQLLLSCTQMQNHMEAPEAKATQIDVNTEDNTSLQIGAYTCKCCCDYVCQRDAELSYAWQSLTLAQTHKHSRRLIFRCCVHAHNVLVSIHTPHTHTHTKEGETSTCNKTCISGSDWKHGWKLSCTFCFSLVGFFNQTQKIRWSSQADGRARLGHTIYTHT
jgi:hypothetical protein